MNYTFNLIDQPWIPCVTLDDEHLELSLDNFLIYAHDIREICGETPLITAAMYPMILALLHRVFGPKNISEWESLWNEGKFPAKKIKEYTSKWRNRFDLFHPEYPFYQAKDERVEPKSVLYLAEPIANSPTLFNHRTEAEKIALTPAQATRKLLMAQAFRLGGGISGKLTRNFIQSIFASGIIFLASGNNIFETLMLNLIRYPWEHVMPSTPQDKPVWEMENPFEHRGFSQGQKDAVPYGYLDYLTWQTNHILLIPENGAHGTVVKEVTIAPIMPLKTDVRSPQKRYTMTEGKKGPDWKFMYFNSEKALWRNYHSLITFNDHVHPPTVVEWFNDLALQILDEDAVLQLTAIGMLADQAKPMFYRQSTIPIPASILGDDNKALDIKLALEQSEKVDEQLYYAVKELAVHVLKRGGNSSLDPNDVKNLISQWNARSVYWARLEPKFWEFVDATAKDNDEAIDLWQATLKAAANDALSSAINMAGTGTAALHGQVIAKRVLNAGIKKVFK